METESPVLFRILDGNTLPNWSDRFLRNIDLASARSLRDTQEDAFQGHTIRLPFPYLINHNFGYNLIWQNGTYGSFAASETHLGFIVSDEVNGIPRTAKETRPKNFAAMYQIVRG